MMGDDQHSWVDLQPNEIDSTDTLRSKRAKLAEILKGKIVKLAKYASEHQEPPAKRPKLSHPLHRLDLPSLSNSGSHVTAQKEAEQAKGWLSKSRLLNFSTPQARRLPAPGQARKLNDQLVETSTIQTGALIRATPDTSTAAETGPVLPSDPRYKPLQLLQSVQPAQKLNTHNCEGRALPKESCPTKALDPDVSTPSGQADGSVTFLKQSELMPQNKEPKDRNRVPKAIGAEPAAASLDRCQGIERAEVHHGCGLAQLDPDRTAARKNGAAANAGATAVNGCPVVKPKHMNLSELLKGTRPLKQSEHDVVGAVDHAKPSDSSPNGRAKGQKCSAKPKERGPAQTKLIYKQTARDMSTAGGSKAEPSSPVWKTRKRRGRKAAQQTTLPLQPLRAQPVRPLLFQGPPVAIFPDRQLPATRPPQRSSPSRRQQIVRTEIVDLTAAIPDTPATKIKSRPACDALVPETPDDENLSMPGRSKSKANQTLPAADQSLRTRSPGEQPGPRQQLQFCSQGHQSATVRESPEQEVAELPMTLPNLALDQAEVIPDRNARQEEVSKAAVAVEEAGPSSVDLAPQKEIQRVAGHLTTSRVLLPEDETPDLSEPFGIRVPDTVSSSPDQADLAINRASPEKRGGVVNESNQGPSPDDGAMLARLPQSDTEQHSTKNLDIITAQLEDLDCVPCTDPESHSPANQLLQAKTKESKRTLPETGEHENPHLSNGPVNEEPAKRPNNPDEIIVGEADRKAHVLAPRQISRTGVKAFQNRKAPSRRDQHSNQDLSTAFERWKDPITTAALNPALCETFIADTLAPQSLWGLAQMSMTSQNDSELIQAANDRHVVDLKADVAYNGHSSRSRDSPETADGDLGKEEYESDSRSSDSMGPSSEGLIRRLSQPGPRCMSSLLHSKQGPPSALLPKNHAMDKDMCQQETAAASALENGPVESSFQNEAGSPRQAHSASKGTGVFSSQFVQSADESANIRTGRTEVILDCKARVIAACASTQSGKMAILLEPKPFPSNNLIVVELAQHSGPIVCWQRPFIPAAISSDQHMAFLDQNKAERLCVVGKDQSVHTFDLTSELREQQVFASALHISCLIGSEDGSTIFTGGKCGQLAQCQADFTSSTASRSWGVFHQGAFCTSGAALKNLHQLRSDHVVGLSQVGDLWVWNISRRICVSHYCNPFLSIQRVIRFPFSLQKSEAFILTASHRGSQQQIADRGDSTLEQNWMTAKLKDGSIHTREMRESLGVSFSCTSGNKLAMSTTTGAVSIWDLEQAVCLASSQALSGGRVTQMQFLLSGRQTQDAAILAVVDDGRCLYLKP